MEQKTITTEMVLEKFHQGFDCSQVVLAYASNKIGIDEETALKVASPFGGGMWHGETCGCVTGALMAIGLKYGHAVAGDQATKNNMLQKKAEFESAFKTAEGSCLCRDLLNHDLSIPGELQKVMEENLFATVCAKAVCSACEILDGIL
ncbi:MAG: C-GCAxxG-C-C family protein [Anaerovoracaceae bacterium]